MSSPEAAEKALIIPEATLRALAAQYGTPLWAYGAATSTAGSSVSRVCADVTECIWR